MIDRLRRMLHDSALGPALVIWGFGYLLVDIFAFLLGRSTAGVMLFTNIPLFCLGVMYTVLLDRLRQRLVDALLPVRILVLGISVLAVTVVHTLTDLYWLRWLALTVFPGWQD